MDQMYTRICGLFFFCCFFSIIRLSVSSGENCFCSNSNLCRIVNRTVDKDVYIYCNNNSPDYFKTFDWSRISVVSVVQLDENLKALVCYGHSRQVKINWYFGFDSWDLSNATQQRILINNITSTVELYHLDGINIDYEKTIQPYSAEYYALTDWVEKITLAVKKIDRNLEVSFAHVNSANVGGRNYDVVAIGRIIDYYVLMEYDFSDCTGQRMCTAGANSGFDVFKTSLETFSKVNITFNKLITAFPWYGYYYPCESYDAKTGLCIYEGTRSSSAGYSQIMQMLRSESPNGRLFDSTSLSPYAFFKQDGKLYRVDYDDYWSLKLKINYAMSVNTRGVGVFHANCLFFDDSVEAQYDRKLIWETLPKVNTTGGEL